MRKLVALWFLIFTINSAFANNTDDNFLNLNGTFYAPGTTVTEEKTPSGRKVIVQQPLDVNLPEFALNKVERRVFNQTFEGDYNLYRLQRLEKRVYGAIQTGDPQKRLQRLIIAARNYTQKPYEYFQTGNNNPYNPYSQYQPYKQSALKNFLNTFTGGTLTGWSPPVTGYNTQSGYNSPYLGNRSILPSNGTNLFSNGASGQETYWDDGQYQRHLNSTDGGIGVKVIY